MTSEIGKVGRLFLKQIFCLFENRGLLDVMGSSVDGSGSVTSDVSSISNGVDVYRHGRPGDSPIMGG